ncbi:hypothetical protein PMG11_11093 [Penicillium brasilianum]|uniref:Short-chain dehydrogenase n=1 Tax=Penicillium brasilianum TaxID=104259 RepID=A0A0F7U2V9_PENBI|nr:hypothetical protein PMG11_11093 [Penicillium brasilianum]
MTAFNFSTTGSEVVAALADRVTGKTFAEKPLVVITGASHGGLGAHTCLCLAAANPAEIILLGRSEEKVSPVIKEISSISPSTVVRFIKIDLLSCASVRATAAEINASVSKIDVLLEASGGGARIVNVASAMYQLSPVMFDNYNFSNGKTYNAWEAYGQSKTANILFAVALAEKLEKKEIKSYFLHPGVIHTTGLSEVDQEAWPIVGALFESKKLEMPKEKTIGQGCATTLAAALDPALDDHSGSFLNDCNPENVLDYASDIVNADKLWCLSEAIVGEEFHY